MVKKSTPTKSEKVSDSKDSKVTKDAGSSKSDKNLLNWFSIRAKQVTSLLSGMGKTADKAKETATEPKSRKRLVAMIASGVVAVAVLLVLVFGVLVYHYKSDSRTTRAVASVVPYPVMKVNGGFVSYHEYLFEVASIKQYYQNQPGTTTKVDFTTADGKAKLKNLKQQVITQLKSDEVSRQLISKNKIKVTTKQVTDQLAQITQSAGGDQKVRQVLSQYYGWTYDDLKRKVKFQLEKQALQTKITGDAKADAAAKAKAESILAQIKAGGDFAALAKQYSQDSTAANGGDLGFFSKGQMVKPFEDAAFALQPGQVSSVVKTQYGYHIIKVIAVKDGQVDAAHILIKTVDFDQYMQTAVSSAKLSQYLKI